MFHNPITRLCLLLASALLCACGNKGDLYLELDDQVVESIGQIDESDDTTDESKSSDADADTDNDDSENDDEKKNRDRNTPGSNS